MSSSVLGWSPWRDTPSNSKSGTPLLKSLLDPLLQRSCRSFTCLRHHQVSFLSVTVRLQLRV
ncbi:unnamed protein product [Brassica oleracea var. botrytis]|uniref:(rape) hypothetical protein n=1 Tax=Brassica napus TaxID=3708 RepID=A0A816KIS5_BRANA|nr:unnamed protein product [Brassica napus]